MSTIVKIAAKEGFWLAGFKFISQLFSWTITVIVARILAPEDYGLMAMASILTGYVEIFSELGLGAAIIQRKEVSREELSSNFWFCVVTGIVFSVIAFCLAYPTAWIFHEQRIIPITQLISVLFLIGALMIVPYNILNREVQFKMIGIIQLTAVIISSASMLFMAKRGLGVWTLIWGTIIFRSTNVILVFLFSRWWPQFHFRINEVRPFLRLGVNVAGSNSLIYVFQKADKFIVGTMFNAQLLGYYSFASHLASIPTDKISSIINQVSLPVFSRYQDDLIRLEDIFLKITKFITLIVVPLFLGSVLFANEIVINLLGIKWGVIVPMFRLFCIAQMLFCLTFIIGNVHISQGRPHWVLLFTFINLIAMSTSIFFAGKIGFDYVLIPWVSVYPIILFIWAWVTLKKMGILISKYLTAIIKTIFAALSILVIVKCLQLYMYKMHIITDIKNVLLWEIVMSVIMYGVYICFFEKKSIISIINLRGKIAK